MNTYHFVKVAAGDSFPFESDYFTLNQHGQYHLSGNHYRQYGERYPFDEYILRPVEPAADGGREAFIEKVLYDADLTRSQGADIAKIMRANWPATGEPAPVDNVALLEWFIDNVAYDGAQSEDKRQYWMKNDGNEWAFKNYYTIAALIQEFINQKTKEA